MLQKQLTVAWLGFKSKKASARGTSGCDTARFKSKGKS